MALLTSLSYARDRLRSAKTHQRVRLGGFATATAAGAVFNRSYCHGTVARVSDRDGQLHFAWTSFPTPPYRHEVTIVGLLAASDPRFDWDGRSHLHLLFTQGGAVWSRTSWDDGQTWTTAVSRWGAGDHADVLRVPSGGLLLFARVGTTLEVRRQALGEATPAAAFVAKDEAAANLELAAESYQVAAEPNGRLWLHYREDGSANTQIRYSTDEGATWAPTPGAVAGFTGGSRPRVTCAPGGSLLATADVGAELAYSRRALGSASWSSPATAKDDAGVDLAVGSQGFAASGAWEGAGRLVLSAVLAGDTTPCDLWSADQGATWAQF